MQVKENPMSINMAQFPQGVLLGLRVREKAVLLATLARQAAEATGSSYAVVLAALQRREALGSTGMGQGIAIPHASVPGLVQPFGLLALLAAPIDFAAVDDLPVDIVVLLLTPQTEKAADLQALSGIARRLRQPAVLAALRQAEDEVDVWDAWERAS